MKKFVLVFLFLIQNSGCTQLSIIDLSIDSDAKICQYYKYYNNDPIYSGERVSYLLDELERRGVSREGCIELTGGEGIYKFKPLNQSRIEIIDPLHNIKERYSLDTLSKNKNKYNESYSSSLIRVKQKLFKLNYIEDTNDFDDSKIEIVLSSYLSDEGVCSKVSNPVDNKNIDILPYQLCKYYFNGTLWSRIDFVKIIKSSSLDNLLNSSIERIR